MGKNITQSARVWLVVGSVSFILLGFGHLVSHLAVMLSTEARPPVVNMMQEYSVPMPGREIDLLSLHHGFSLMMGILLIALGALSLCFPRMDQTFPFRSGPAIGLCVALAAITLVVSLKYFFIVPVLCSLLSLVAYGAVLLIIKRPGPRGTES